MITTEAVYFANWMNGLGLPGGSFYELDVTVAGVMLDIQRELNLDALDALEDAKG